MNNREELEDELAELESLHKKLDDAIDNNLSFYLSDQELVKMKHERLIIKQSIESIKKQLGL